MFIVCVILTPDTPQVRYTCTISVIIPQKGNIYVNLLMVKIPAEFKAVVGVHTLFPKMIIANTDTRDEKKTKMAKHMLECAAMESKANYPRFLMSMI